MKLIATKNTPEERTRRRNLRDTWMKITDAYMWPDRNLDEAQMAELLAFRQALRDYPVEEAKVTDWVWPTQPSFMRETPPSF